MLQIVARTMARSARPFDVVGRWGGEEFVAVAAHVDREQLETLADRFRALVRESRLWVGDCEVGGTLSVGAAAARPGETALGLVARADRLMYEAKWAGGDRVRVG